jgi:hypothetical protein
MREKAKAKQQDKAVESKDTGPNDFLNDPDDTTPTDNDATGPVEPTSTNEDEPTDQAVGEVLFSTLHSLR